jgi:protein TonB
MGILNDWNDVVNPQRVELVFERKNKAYGAYVIRKEYNRRLLLAFIFSLAAIILSIAIPVVINLISESDLMKRSTIAEEITLAEPPPIDKSTPPPPPVEPPPPVQKTIQFTPPKVVKDELLEEPPPTQEEVKEVQVATQTQEGTDIVDLPPENPVVGDPDENKVFLTVEEMPEFPGGDQKLLEYVQKNIKYPPVARENGIQGVVYVSFVVDREGKVKDAKILRGIGGGCDQEALRVIQGLPSWKPGKQNGRPVQVQYNMPVRFTLKS